MTAAGGGGRAVAIIPAAGRGDRLGAGGPKALVDIGGRTLLQHAAERLLAGGIDLLVVAVPPGRATEVGRLLPEALVVDGGSTRQESVRLALAALPTDADVVLVHDAARAFVPAGMVARVLAAVRSGAEAVVPVLPLADTVKEVDSSGVVRRTVDRERLRAAQTPQGFRRDVLERAHGPAAEQPGAAATDDAALAERLGVRVVTVEGAPEAMKVTTPWDLRVVRALLADGAGRPAGAAGLDRAPVAGGAPRVRP